MFLISCLLLAGLSTPCIAHTQQDGANEQQAIRLQQEPTQEVAEQRIAELKSRKAILESEAHPDPALQRALASAIVTWEAWPSIFAPLSPVPAQQDLSSELAELLKQAVLARTEIDQLIASQDEVYAKGRSALELRDYLKVELAVVASKQRRVAESSAQAVSRIRERLARIRWDLGQNFARQIEISAELDSRAQALRSQPEARLAETLELRVETAEQERWQKRVRAEWLQAELLQLENLESTASARASHHRLRAELASLHVSIARQQLARLAEQERRILDEVNEDDAEILGDELRALRSENLHWIEENALLGIELESLRTTRDLARERLRQLQQLSMPMAAGLSSELALTELERLEENADFESYQNEILRLQSVAEEAEAQWAEWTFTEEQFLPKHWRTAPAAISVKRPPEIELQFAEARALQGQLLRENMSAAKSALAIRTQLRELRLERQSFLRRRNLFLRVPFAIRPAEISAELSQLSQLPTSIRSGSIALSAWLGRASHALSLLGLALAATAMVWAVRRLGSRTERVLLKHFPAPSASTSDLKMQREWGQHLASRMARPILVCSVLWLIIRAAIWLLPHISPEVMSSLAMLQWTLPALLLCFAAISRVISPQANGRFAWEASPDKAARTLSVVRICWLTAAVSAVGLWLVRSSTFGMTAWQDSFGFLLDLSIAIALLALARKDGPLGLLIPLPPAPAWIRQLLHAFRLLIVALIFGVMLLRLLGFEFLVNQVVDASLNLFVITGIAILTHQFLAAGVHAIRQHAQSGSKARTEELYPVPSGAGIPLLGATLTCFLAISGLGWLDQWGVLSMLEQPIPLIGLRTEDPTTWWMLVEALLLLAWGVFLGKVVGLLIAGLGSRNNREDAGLRYTASKITSYSIIGLGGYFALTAVFETASLGYAVAALSLGIGFGLQEIVSNFVSGLILLFERPIQVGDLVQAGSTVGVVDRINIRATTVRTLDNEFILVPNRELVAQNVTNLTHQDPRIRIRVLVGVEYGSDLQLAETMMLQAAQEQELVLKRPKPEVFFTNFGESSLDLELRAWVRKPLDRAIASSALRHRIDSLFRESDIVIPFPQRDLHVKGRVELQPNSPPDPPTQDGPDKAGQSTS